MSLDLDDEDRPEDPLAAALAAYDESLSACGEVPVNGDQAIDPALLPELQKAEAFLWLLHQAWPGGDAPSPDTGPVMVAETARAWPTASVEPGQTNFGRFRIVRGLGQGGFGVVFQAWDPAMRRTVALKVPQPEALLSPDVRKRFLREAQAAAGLDHPNIVPVFEVGEVGAICFIASAYCEGPTVAEWLAEHEGPVDSRDAARLVATLAEAVQHAHDRGILHRDLKPSNILLQTKDAAEGPFGLADLVPRVTDFSLAKIVELEGDPTKSGVPIGSPPYMAPEQAEGKQSAIGPATDVYALGCVLYEVLCGRTPFQGETALETLRQAVADDPPPPRRLRPDIPAALEGIVLKCLEKVSARRYPSARALAEDLGRFLDGRPTLARPPGRWENLGRKARRHPAALVGPSICVILAGALLGGGQWFKTRLDRTQAIARQREKEMRERDLAARRTQYIADIRLAKPMIDSRNVARALELLARHRPRPGEEDLREFAWYYLMRQADTSRRTLWGITDQVYHVEFSPRGDLLAATTKDGTVRIWETTNWQQVRTINASPTEVNGAAFSPDGKALATVDDDGYLKLWETDTGRLHLERLAHTGEALIARFTADGKAVMTGGRTDECVRIWDRSTGAMLDGFHANGFILSPDSRTLAIGGAGGEINLYDSSTRNHMTSLPGTHGTRDATFSHDGITLATVHDGNRMPRLWEVRSGRLLHELHGHTEGVVSLAFARDDRMIFSGSDDLLIRFWDVATGDPRGSHRGHSGRIWSLAVSPDGRTIASASADGTVKLWDSEPPHDDAIIHLDRPLAAVRFSVDGKTLATLEKDGTFTLRQTGGGAILRRRRLDPSTAPRPSGWFASSADISGDLRTLLIEDSDAAISLWDAEHGHRTASLGSWQTPSSGLGITPDGIHFYIVRTEQNVRRIEFWDVKGARLQSTLEGDFGGQVGFLRGNRLVVQGGVRNIPMLWEPLHDRVREAPKTMFFQAQSAVHSTDGRILVFQNHFEGVLGNRPLHTWDTERWAKIPISIRCPVRLSSMAIDPTNRTLAGVGEDGMVRLWDLASGDDLLTLEGHSSWVCVCFAPDGKTLASFADRPDGTSEIFLWRAAKDEAKPADGGEGAGAGSPP